jgi:hypothetical protein
MLIAALEENFDFSDPVSMLLSDEQVYATIGTWKRGRITKLWPSTTSTQRVPPHVPGSVLLLVAKYDWFPYVVEYRRESRPIAGDDVSAFRMQPDPLVLLRFYDVSFDGSIDPQQFEYTPRDVDPVDLTAEHLERFRERVARRDGPAF